MQSNGILIIVIKLLFMVVFTFKHLEALLVRAKLRKILKPHYEPKIFLKVGGIYGTNLVGIGPVVFLEGTLHTCILWQY